MPLYDYLCDRCGRHVEERRSYEDRDSLHACVSLRDSDLDCPGLLRRVWVGRAPGVAFRGPGWSNLERFNREQAKIKAEADAEWKVEHEANWTRDMEKAINEAKPMTDAQAEKADRAAFELAKRGVSVAAV